MSAGASPGPVESYLVSSTEQPLKKKPKRAPAWTPFVSDNNRGENNNMSYNPQTDAILAFRHLATVDDALKAHIDVICANNALDTPHAAELAANFVQKVVSSSPFLTMVRCITCTRVNKSVGANAIRSLAEACGGESSESKSLDDVLTTITPAAIAAIDEEELAKEVTKGFSCFQKAKYLHHLSGSAIEDPTLLSLERLNSLTDAQLLEDSALNAVNGIGPGTLIHMLACSQVARPDVLPYTDSLLRKFVLGDDFAKQYDIKKAEGERAVCAKLDEETAAWKPWRSIGAMLAFDEKNALHD